MEKKCNRCKEVKEIITGFKFKEASQNGNRRYSSICKKCKSNTRKEKLRIFRLTTPKKTRPKMSVEEKRRRLDLAYSNQKAKKAITKSWLLELKKTLSCNICNLSFKDQPWLLDFHHKDPATKLFALSETTKHTKSKEALLLEISKCAPLCANCHRTLHYMEKQGICIEC